MKNNNDWKLLINPFTRIAGWKAFIIGILIVLATVLTASFFDICFWGVMDAKIIPGISFPTALLFQLIGLAGTVIFMYLFSLLFTRKVRFQDVLGTVTLARFPLLFVALTGFLLSLQNFDADTMVNSLMDGSFNAMDYSSFFIYIFITLIFTAWALILLFYAIRVSTGLDGVKSFILFILTFFFSEIFSNVIVYLITKNSLI